MKAKQTKWRKTAKMVFLDVDGVRVYVDADDVATGHALHVARAIVRGVANEAAWVPPKRSR